MVSPLRLLRGVVARLSRTRAFRIVGRTGIPVAERAIARISGGRLQLSALLVPSLVLHSTGARSGLPRDTPLMYVPDRGGAMLVTGSNFADARHPAWSANLLAHPDVAVTVRGRRIEVRAVLIGDDERESVWRRLEEQWPGYREYERASGRTLRLFRLEPR